MKRLARTVVSIALGVAAFWYACIAPIIFEIKLARLERSTLVAVRATRPDHAGIMARESLKTARDFARWYPEDIRLAMVEGANHLIIGNPAGAKAAYERALRYDQRPEIYLNLAFAERKSGHIDSAARHLAKALRFSPEMAADVVMDPDLRRRALAILRGGAVSPPFCCAADYTGDDRVAVLSVEKTVAKTTPPSALAIAIARDWSPEIAWNESKNTFLLLRKIDGSVAEIAHLGRGGVGRGHEAIGAIPELWRAVCGGALTPSTRRAILLSNPTTGDVRLRTLGSSETEVPVLLREDNAYIATCADFSGDGEADALYRSETGKDYVLLLRDMRKESFVPLPSAGFHRDLVAAADFTGDGLVDILWYDYEIDRLLLWVLDRYSLHRVVYWP